MKLFTNSAQDLELADLLGESVAVLGIKGSGKSNTAARISEQALDAGLPLTIVDIAGEYWGLKEKYPLVVAGRSANSDLPLTSPEQAEALALWSIAERVSVILDLSGYKMDARMELLQAYLEALWDKAGELRRPYHIVLEEARNWIPQGQPTPVKDVLISIATEGRKRGLGIIIVGQRSAKIDKDVLTQAGIAILHRVRFPTDIAVYREIIPRESAWVKKTVTGLATGEAVVVTNTDVLVAKVLPRQTYHAGFTPGMEQVEPPTLTSVDPAMLAALHKLIQSDTPAPAGGDLSVRRVAAGRDAAVISSTAQAQIVEKQNQTIVDMERQLKAEKQRFTDFVNDIWAALRCGGDWQYPGEVVQEVTALRERAELPKTGTFLVPTSAPVVTPEAAAPAPAKPAPTKPEAGAEARLKKQENIVINRQRKRLAEVCARVSQQMQQHRLLLSFLLNRQNKVIRSGVLARSLGYSEDRFARNPPIELIDLDIVCRNDDRALQMGYWVNTTELQQMFPNLAMNEIITALRAACEV